MKNFAKLFDIIAIVAVIGFSIIACDNGGGGGGGTRDAKTYTGTDSGGVVYTLKIEDSGSRAVLTPTQGDKYTLTQTANTKKSTGKVTKVVGGVLTLEPSGDPNDTFTATVSGDGITAMSGTITWDDGTANTVPATLTPPVTNPGTGGPTNWTEVTDSPFISSGLYRINAFAYGGGKWVAGCGFTVHEGYIKIAYSTDNGVKWEGVDTTAWDNGYPIRAIAYGNNRFVAGGYDGIMAYSDDGVNWIAVADSKFGTNGYISAIAYGNGRFVAVGGEGKMAYSDDGVTWTAVADSKFPSTLTNTSDAYIINAITYGNNRFVAVGDEGRMAYSTDGVNWTAGGDSTFGYYQVHAIAYGNNRFVAVGAIGKMAYSSDGVTWTAVEDTSIWKWTAGFSSGTTEIRAIAYGNGRFVAGGDNGKVAYADW